MYYYSGMFPFLLPLSSTFDKTLDRNKRNFKLSLSKPKTTSIQGIFLVFIPSNHFLSFFFDVQSTRLEKRNTKFSHLKTSKNTSIHVIFFVFIPSHHFLSQPLVLTLLQSKSISHSNPIPIFSSYTQSFTSASPSRPHIKEFLPSLAVAPHHRLLELK